MRRAYGQSHLWPQATTQIVGTPCHHSVTKKKFGAVRAGGTAESPDCLDIDSKAWIRRSAHLAGDEHSDEVFLDH